MNFRRVLLFLASVVLCAVLVVFLIRIGKVDVQLTLHQLERVSPLNFMKLVLLNGLLVYLSTMKWRSIDVAWRRPSDFVPSRVASFFVSSMGMALGLILPVQLGMTVARTIGTHTYGRPLKRGTVGTLFEQSFDFMIMVLLTAASAVTWLCGGGAAMWTVSAATLIAIALLAVSPLIRLVRRLFLYASRNVIYESSLRPGHRLKKFMAHALRRFSELQHSGLVNARLARRLLMLSAVRFCVIVLMAYQTSEAIAAHILLWRMAAATPFATIANLIGVTPGGIGVNELTSVAALHLYGTPLAAASQWALANRLLVTGSCFAVATCASVMLGIENIVAPGRRTANWSGKSEGV
jgi:hypothetical protein